MYYFTCNTRSLIVRTPLFLREERILMASLRRGESEKLKKGWKHAAGTDLLKRVSWHFFFFFFFYFLFFFFSNFIIFTFRNYFNLWKIVLYIWRKNFSATIILWNSHSKLSQNEPVFMCKESSCVGLGQEGGCFCNSKGTAWNILEGGGIF